MPSLGDIFDFGLDIVGGIQDFQQIGRGNPADQYNQDVYAYQNEEQERFAYIDWRNVLKNQQNTEQNQLRAHHWDYITGFTKWKLDDQQAEADADLRTIAWETDFSNRFNTWKASEQTRKYQTERDQLSFRIAELGRAAAHSNATTNFRIQDIQAASAVEEGNWQVFQKHQDQQHAVRLARIEENLRYEMQDLYNENVRSVANYRHDTAVGEIGAAMIGAQVKAAQGSKQAKERALHEGGRILAQGQSGRVVQKMLLTALQDRLEADQEAEQAHATISAGTRIAMASQKLKLKDDLLNQEYVAKRKFFDPVRGPIKSYIRAPEPPGFVQRAGPADFVASSSPLVGPRPIGYVRAPKPNPGPRPTRPDYQEEPVTGAPAPNPGGYGSQGSGNNVFLDSINFLAKQARKIEERKSENP